MIVYLWTAVARDNAEPHGNLGISDNDCRARDAAEQCLRDGQAQLAFVETARTGVVPHSFSPCYVPTGLGWWATPGPVGEVSWVRFTSPDAAAGLRALAESAEWTDRDN